MRTYQNNTLLDALAGRVPEHTPVWLMRQAGRYLPEYRQLRAEAGSFLALAKNPELAAEVTRQPVDRFGMDAAIIFSDILTIPDALGMGLTFEPGKGPAFASPLAFKNGAPDLPEIDVREELSYVAEAIRHTINDRYPVIGFSGSPFTLACYMVDAGASKGFLQTRRLLYAQPELLHRLLELLARLVADYLIMQAEAGAAVLQIFDSWGGLLSTPAFERFDLAYIREIITALRAHPATAEIPVIAFTKDAPLHWYPMLRDAGATAVSVDWRHDLRIVAREVPDLVLQGNLDPAALLGSVEELERAAKEVLAAVPRERAHIFNLGHGIDKSTDPELVRHLVDLVHHNPYR